MTNSSKIGFVLAFLVLGVFLMRNAEVSVGTVSKHALRRALYMVKDGVVSWKSSAGNNICTNINIDTPFSQSELDQAQSVKTSVQSMRGGNPLRTALEGGSVDWLNYAMSLIPLIAPWLALFVISDIICLGLCCSWCCMHGCCKNTKCCACCKQPQIFKKKWVYVGVTVVMLLGTFSAGIAGATFSGKVPSGMQLTLCSFIGMVEDFTEGKQNYPFMGLQGVQNGLQNIIDQFTTVVNKLNSLSSHTTLDSKYTTAKTDIDNLYNSNKGTNTVQRGGGDQAVGTKYTPDYIANLGPKETKDTATNLVYLEFQLQYDTVVSAQDSISPAVSTLKTQQTTIVDGLKSGKSAVSDVQTMINNLMDALGGVGSTIKDVFSGIGSALVAIFVVFIVIAVLVILSILIIIKKKVKFLNKFLHFSWCVMGLLTLITWLISAIFYPISVVMMEGCDVIEVVLTDQTSRKNIFSGLTTGTAVDMFTQCLTVNTDGTEPDFASPFGLNNYLKDFRTVFTSLDSVDKVFPSLSTKPTSIVIPAQYKIVNDFITGVNPDSTNTVNDLAGLNQATNKNSANPSGCTNLQDKWVLGSASCASGDTVFATGSADNYNVNSATCIGFDKWGNTHTSNGRYTGQFGTCSNIGSKTAESYAKAAVDNFVTNRANLATTLNPIKTSFNTGGTLLTDYDNFATELFTILQNFQSLKTDLSAITDSLDGASNGLLANLKCGFIRTDLIRISSSMCTGFVVNLYQTSVALIVTSFFTLFSTIAVFLLTKRILLPEYLAAKTSPSGFSPPGNQFSPY